LPQAENSLAVSELVKSRNKVTIPFFLFGTDGILHSRLDQINWENCHVGNCAADATNDHIAYERVYVHMQVHVLTGATMGSESGLGHCLKSLHIKARTKKDERNSGEFSACLQHARFCYTSPLLYKLLVVDTSKASYVH
jgi:hypothetical protein